LEITVRTGFKIDGSSDGFDADKGSDFLGTEATVIGLDTALGGGLGAADTAFEGGLDTALGGGLGAADTAFEGGLDTALGGGLGAADTAFEGGLDTALGGGLGAGLLCLGTGLFCFNIFIYYTII
jgi:hypothetical protein